jgi:hypothetical protein
MYCTNVQELPKMTETPKKRGPGRPRRYAPGRQNLAFRVTPELREKLIKAVQLSGRSLSEEVEFRLERSAEIDRLYAEAKAYAAAAREELEVKKILAYRAAGLGILREVTGKPTSVIISVAMLDAEAAGLMRAWVGGFTAEKPAGPESRPRTADEDARLDKEIEQMRADVAAAMAPGKSEDAA